MIVGLMIYKWHWTPNEAIFSRSLDIANILMLMRTQLSKKIRLSGKACLHISSITNCFPRCHVREERAIIFRNSLDFVTCADDEYCIGFSVSIVRMCCEIEMV